jgi:hypothetical protein
VNAAICSAALSRANDIAEPLHPKGLEKGIDRSQAGAGNKPGFFIVEAGTRAMVYLSPGLLQLNSQLLDQPSRFLVQRRSAKIIS